MERYLPAEEQQAILEDIKSLEGRNNLTLLLDGWDDALRRSVYGCLLAEVAVHPVILSLHELTGRCATAENLVEVADKALERKSMNPSAVIATCTDNPTTMQAFCRLLADKYSWILVHSSQS
jgi:hypothetical protein